MQKFKKVKPLLLVAMTCTLVTGPVLAQFERPPAHSPGERVVLNFSHALPNIPGKSLIAVEVNYAPGGKSLPHRHAPSAFIYGYVVSGSIRSQLAGGPVRVYKAGESFFENPGEHHLVGENASSTVPAKLLAVFIVDTDHGPLTTPDARGQRP